MFNRRYKNVEIFKNTEYVYQTNEELKAAIANSCGKQYFLAADTEIPAVPKQDRDGKVLVSEKKTLEASEPYARQGKRVCILNFASATNPGGGVVWGSSAQEESICRCSTLYPCLIKEDMWDQFYNPHRKADNPLYNDDCIFTPSVKVFKSDTDVPKLLQNAEWWDVDVITCAAPNLRDIPSNMMNPGAGSTQVDITMEDLRALLTNRIQRIFEIAVSQGPDVLILGAFGCGAFKNPPQLVASVFAEFTEKYRNYFDVIEYAVFHMAHEIENYEAFKKSMERFN